MAETSVDQEEALRKVFFISDRTGLTAQSFGKTLLAQFPDQKYEIITLPFVNSKQKAIAAGKQINTANDETGKQSIVFTTIISDSLQKILENSEACVINLYNTFVGPLEACFGEESSHAAGKTRAIFGNQDYQKRLDAIDYSLSHDDGLHYNNYEEADVILCGVSRCGKTPTSLFLAMNFSMKVSNYPLTEEDFKNNTLPECLLKHREKLVALTIKVAPLSRIRKARRPNSEYASFEVCEREVKSAKQMFAKANLPVFDTTDTSIEEIASEVVQVLNMSTKDGILRA